jgi:hypothetical protein
MVNLRGSSSWRHLDGAMLNQSVKWKSRAKPFGAIKMWQRVLMLGLVIIGLSTASARAQDDIGAASTVRKTTFDLAFNPKLMSTTCLEQSSRQTPKATVSVTKGSLNDTLVIRLEHFKPGLDFDLFTIQNSPLQSDGTTDSTFTNFGLAWYQSDIKIGPLGYGSVKINTKLANEIFGFDPSVPDADDPSPSTVALPPTNAFHVGFWFDNPDDATECFGGITPAKTPFNGTHDAGPNAMISESVAPDDLGPLCLNPIGVGACSP